MNLFHKIIIYFGTIVILISLVLSFKLRKKKELPAYFKFFYWIPFIALLISLNGVIGIDFNNFTDLVFYIFQHLFFLSEFTITCLFFYIILGPKNKLVTLAFSVATIFFVILLFNNGLDKASFQVYAAPGLAIFVLCMYYYYRLFDHDEKPILNLFTTPTFWIVTGLFFFSAITLPLFAIQEYIFYKFGYRIATYVIAFVNIFGIIKHLFFIKAYRCAAKMQVEESKIIIDDV